jgi:hypothetical protein
MDWIKKQMTNIALAVGNVGQNVLNQDKIEGGVETSKHQRLNQNSVMDALLRGEITEEVEKLRWRIYKTTSAMKNVNVKVIGYDDDGYPITETYYTGDEDKLKKIKTEPSDDYELIMVVDNTNITTSVLTSLNLDINIYDEAVESKTVNIISGDTTNIDDTITNGSNIDLEIESKTIGEVKDNKVELITPISIIREHRPKFELEKYTKKLHVKKINNKEFLLEFYISKYPTQFDKKSDFFLSDIKKILATPNRYNSTVDINKVSFVTNNTVGVPDFLEFEYEIKRFDKIVEFNEFYVLKFTSNITIDAKSIIDKYRNDEVDEKYKNKEKR